MTNRGPERRTGETETLIDTNPEETLEKAGGLLKEDNFVATALRNLLATDDLHMGRRMEIYLKEHLLQKIYRVLAPDSAQKGIQEIMQAGEQETVAVEKIDYNTGDVTFSYIPGGELNELKKFNITLQLLKT